MQFKKSTVYLNKTNCVEVVDGYAVELFGVEFSVYKMENNHWQVIDIETGKSVAGGRTRKEAVADFDAERFEQYEKVRATDHYAEMVREFEALSTENVRDEREEQVEEAADTTEAQEDATQPADVTENNIWFTVQVEGSRPYSGKRKKHQGMFLLPNTPENRERFNIAA